MDRLYVVTRSDLAPGAQLAQSCHAVSAFASAFAELHRLWHSEGQNLVVLAISGEAELRALLKRVASEAVPNALFCEPDLDGELTAIAFGGQGARLVSSLPLALRAPRVLASENSAAAA